MNAVCGIFKDMYYLSGDALVKFIVDEVIRIRKFNTGDLQYLPSMNEIVEKINNYTDTNNIYSSKDICKLLIREYRSAINGYRLDSMVFEYCERLGFSIYYAEYSKCDYKMYGDDMTTCSLLLEFETFIDKSRKTTFGLR